jgi:hypothetical protein
MRQRYFNTEQQEIQFEIHYLRVARLAAGGASYNCDLSVRFIHISPDGYLTFYRYGHCTNRAYILALRERPRKKQLQPVTPKYVKIELPQISPDHGKSIITKHYSTNLPLHSPQTR